MVVGVGFKPTNLIKGTVLQTVAFSHSAIPPRKGCYSEVNGFIPTSHRQCDLQVLNPVRGDRLHCTIS